ncbi:hypothetical protein TURU_052024 [Turdus rufiventris]|nr:hypothetical protein TURU_052024 [Turdus rufiventris]
MDFWCLRSLPDPVALERQSIVLVQAQNNVASPIVPLQVTVEMKAIPFPTQAHTNKIRVHLDLDPAAFGPKLSLEESGRDRRGEKLLALSIEKPPG